MGSTGKSGRMANGNDGLPVVKAWRGPIDDYRNGPVNAEASGRALETIIRPDATVSLGAVGVDVGGVPPSGDDIPRSRGASGNRP